MKRVMRAIPLTQEHDYFGEFYTVGKRLKAMMRDTQIVVE